MAMITTQFLGEDNELITALLCFLRQFLQLVLLLRRARGHRHLNNTQMSSLQYTNVVIPIVLREVNSILSTFI